MKEKRKKNEVLVKMKHSKAAIPVIILMGLLLFLSLIFGISLVTGNGKTVDTIETAGGMQSREMHNEMDQVMEYLKTLDQGVLSNQNALDTVGDYTTLYKNKSDQIKDAAAQISEMIHRYLNETESVDVETANVFKEILDILAAVQAEVEGSDEAFLMLLEEYRTADEDRRLEIEEQFQGLVEKLKERSSMLESCLQKLQEYMDQVPESGIHTGSYQELEQIKDVLERYLKEELTSFMELLDSANLNLAWKLDEGISKLKKEMGFLQESISATKTEISNLYNTVDNNNAQSSEFIRQEFSHVKDSIDQLNEEFLAAHEDVKTLLQELVGDMSKDLESIYGKLQDILKKMSTEMDTLLTEQFTLMADTLTQMEETYLTTLEEYHNKTTENLANMGTDISNQFAGMDTNITKQFEGMDSSISNQFAGMDSSITNQFAGMDSSITNQFAGMDSSISNRFDVMDQNISNQYESLTNIVNLGDDDLKTFLESMYGDLKKELTQVFTFVSNGKKLLASALLTKGVDCEEDATFDEIYQKILSIQQTLLIGVEQIPGTIEYDHHYHADGMGNLPHTDTVEIGLLGGCYTTPVYHTHQGSSSGGGCYTVANTGYNAIECGGGQAINGPHGPDTSGLTYWVGNCTNCGGRVASYGGPGWAACPNVSYVPYTYYTIGCGLATNTIVGYSPSCGLADGQMVGAHIVYEPAYASGYNGDAISTMSLRPLAVEPQPEPTVTVPENFVRTIPEVKTVQVPELQDPAVSFGSSSGEGTGEVIATVQSEEAAQDTVDPPEATEPPEATDEATVEPEVTEEPESAEEAAEPVTETEAGES